MSDRDEIYDYIKREINPYGRPFKGTAFEFGVKIMDYIKNMSDKSGWIPVSERLPEDGIYITTLDGELVGQEEPFTGMCGIENGMMRTVLLPGCHFQNRIRRMIRMVTRLIYWIFQSRKKHCRCCCLTCKYFEECKIGP